MMELVSQSVDVVEAGIVKQLPNIRQDNSSTAHLTPMHFIHHTLHGFL
jgi:hypothetical protein